jgi:metallo-beta-lactamase class B
MVSRLLGDTTVKIVATPGHTMGTISPVFTVYDDMTEHRVMLWGGSSFNFGNDKLDQLQTYIDSTRRAKLLAQNNKVDTLISNHALYDRAIDKLGLMHRNIDSGNLFVLGQQSVAETFDVIESCAEATLAKWKVEAERSKSGVKK